MTPEYIKNAATAYIRRLSTLEEQRASLAAEIESIKRIGIDSPNNPIISELYQFEYGNYFEFVRQVAQELRRGHGVF